MECRSAPRMNQPGPRILDESILWDSVWRCKDGGRLASWLRPGGTQTCTRQQLPGDPKTRNTTALGALPELLPQMRLGITSAWTRLSSFWLGAVLSAQVRISMPRRSARECFVWPGHRAESSTKLFYCHWQRSDKRSALRNLLPFLVAAPEPS